MPEILFTPRELDVMAVLWQRGGATVADVREAIDEPLAYTSVLSVLQTLTEKGYVRHEAVGRAYRYLPTVGPERAGRSAIARIRDAIFAGSAERLFAQLVADEGVPRESLERMRRLLVERLEAGGSGADGVLEPADRQGRDTAPTTDAARGERE
jgi:predicted transcriptional regulator